MERYVGQELQARGGWKATVKVVEEDGSFITHQNSWSHGESTVGHKTCGTAFHHNPNYDVLGEWPKLESKPFSPTLYDMVAMAAITGLSQNVKLDTSKVVEYAHRIAGEYCQSAGVK